jgi:hypothetical protein
MEVMVLDTLGKGQGNLLNPAAMIRKKRLGDI